MKNVEELLLCENLEAEVSKISFEAAMKLFEELVAKVESGSLVLDDSLRAYDRGVVLIRYLRSLLTGAEEKIQLLSREVEEKG